MKKVLIINNLYVKSNICLTLGSTTTIITDMCGTLTKNVMSVTDILIGNQISEAKELADLFKYLNERAGSSPTNILPVLELIAHNFSINSDDYSQITENGIQSGNRIDCAMLGLVKSMGLDYMKIRQAPEYAASDGLKWGRNAGEGAGRGNPPILAFSSSRKRQSWLLPLRSRDWCAYDSDQYTPSYALGDDQLRMHCKGASEVVLNRCSFYLDENNIKQDMTEAYKTKVLNTIIDFSNQGKRTLVTAYRDFPSWIVFEDQLNKCYQTPRLESGDQTQEQIDCDPERNMIFLCCVAIRDALRPGIKSAVDRCREAGITSIMTTGETINVAVAVAIEAGIIVGANPMAVDVQDPMILQRLSDENIAMTGSDFSKR